MSVRERQRANERERTRASERERERERERESERERHTHSELSQPRDGLAGRGVHDDRGTSPIRNRRPLGPYSRTVHRALWGS